MIRQILYVVAGIAAYDLVVKGVLGNFLPTAG